jgi:hypothetical protein
MKIKFIAYVNLLDALIQEGILKRDPNDRNRVIIYREHVKEEGLPEEGWFSMNVFEVAQELYDNRKCRDSLYESLKANGLTPEFTADGDFRQLT